ncbi:MAG: hypothetical protein JWM68_182 [Verrucomicrobiales bacterium]|nr:hypothetical protein [Verrucomicrobiales bacterium]
MWAFLLAGVVQIYFLLGMKTPPAAAGNSSMAFLAAIPLFISTAIRWLVLPRIKAAQRALPLFLVGIALSEAVCILGLFIFTGAKLPLFCLSVLGILQFAPFYAGKYE